MSFSVPTLLTCTSSLRWPGLYLLPQVAWAAPPPSDESLRASLLIITPHQVLDSACGAGVSVGTWSTVK